MSKPENGAARNTMSEFERQCYDWGWSDAEQRIVKLIEETLLIHSDQKFFLTRSIKGELK